MEKGNARYESNRGKLKDTQAPEDREKRPFEDFGYYVTISMPGKLRYMTEDDMPALAELIARRDAQRKEKWARPDAHHAGRQMHQGAADARFVPHA